MKKMRKAVGLLLASAMVVSAFAGCGGSGKATPDALAIGGIGPVTGDAALYGLAVKQGAELAVEEINAAGGINGMQIEFKFEDDVHKAENSVNAYNSLKDWGMELLMGTVTSDPCIAVVEKAHDDNMYMLTPSGSAVDCIKYDNAFRVCYSDPNQGAASAVYIGENDLATKVAVIYDNSVSYSTGIYESFAAEAKNQDFEIVEVQTFVADTTSDFTVQLTKAKEAGADLVFLPIYYEAASLILTQADTMGYAPKFFGCDGMDGILSMDEFDTSLAEGLMLLTPFAADGQDDLTKNFVTKYEKAYGSTPIQFAADAYDAIYIIKAAAEKAGITKDMSASELCDAMKAVMTQVSYTGLTTAGEAMSWTADGEPEKAPMAVVIKDGAYASMN